MYKLKESRAKPSYVSKYARISVSFHHLYYLHADSVVIAHVMDYKILSLFLSSHRFQFVDKSLISL